MAYSVTAIKAKVKHWLGKFFLSSKQNQLIQLEIPF